MTVVTLPPSIEEYIAGLAERVANIERGGNVKRGIATLAFAASKNSGTISVEHGLGVVPVAVVATAFNAPAFTQLVLPNVFGYTATTFSMNGELAANTTGSLTVAWVAVA